MNKIVSALALFISIHTFAQQAPVGEWKDYLPYNNGLSVAPAAHRVYIAAGSGVFFVELTDRSITRMSRVTGLSDVGAKVVRYSKDYKTLVIGYSNGNIDLIIEDNTIENFSDIKRATSIFGNKTINDVMFIDRYAYIATNFGISVFDLQAREFKETYIIGPNGTNLNVMETTTDGTYLYAATDIGIYRANLNNPNLVDYNNWSLLQGIPNGEGKAYNAVCFVHNKLYANLHKETYFSDTCFVWDGNTWAERDPAYHWGISALNASNDYLLLTSPDIGTIVFNSTGSSVGSLDISAHPEIRLSESMYDDLGNLWSSDLQRGAVCTFGPFGFQYFTPDGPLTKKTLNMVFNNGDLWTVPGGTVYYESQYNHSIVSRYNGINWVNYTGATYPALGQTFDLMQVAIDPKDPEHAYFTSWGRGLLELKEGQFYLYDSTNTSVIKKSTDGSGNTYLAGATFDNKGTLWFGNSYFGSGNAHRLLSRSADGTFANYTDLSTLLGGQKFMGPICVNSLNQKWVVLARGGGILVFKQAPNGSIPVANRRVLKSGAGQGALPDDDVRCVVEDKDGLMWVGTANGVCIFYSPNAVLDGSGNFDAQKPGIVEGGFFYALLENEKVTSIAVDGANRKWIGTEKGGLFLVSADGSQQLKAFNIDNSLLLSNTILSIAIDPESGEVFVATDEGLVSYRGDATEAGEDYGDQVYAFPNPVKPGYKGPISIKGLVADADVKITDVAGRIVYQTRANGGQATWDGNGFDGERAKSGVYLVFTTNADGSKTKVAKIMLVN